MHCTPTMEKIARIGFLSTQLIKIETDAWEGALLVKYLENTFYCAHCTLLFCSAENAIKEFAGVVI